MFCYGCKYEFPSGVTHCSECGAMLVHNFPSAKRLDTADMVSLCRYCNEPDADSARSALHSAGIESVVKTGDNGLEILVRCADAPDALAILNMDIDEESIWFD